MTSDRSFERNARAWLEHGPTDPPIHVIEDVLLAIESTPQERDLRVPWRLPRMTISIRLATAAAIGAIAIGAGVMYVGNLQSEVGGPSPSPTTLVAPSADIAALAQALQAKWVSVGGRKDPIGLEPYQHDFAINQTSLVLNEFKGPTSSSWSLITRGTIALRLDDPQAWLTAAQWTDCRTGDIGSYAISLSVGGRTLTFNPIDEPCATRSTILMGDWSRWPCSNPESVCQAELTPGRHTGRFLPAEDPSGTSSPLPMALSEFSYTVPAGWSQLENTNALGRPNDPATMYLGLTLDVAAHAQTPDCADGTAPGVGGTADELATWLVGLPGLVTTVPQPISLGGYTGQMLDLSVEPTWTQPCQAFYSAPERVVFTFADPVPPRDGISIRDYLERDTHARYILLDLEAGHNLLIEVLAPDQASWTDLVQAATPIVESFEFSTP